MEFTRVSDLGVETNTHPRIDLIDVRVEVDQWDLI